MMGEFHCSIPHARDGFGPVAQLVEHRPFKAVVAGSSPARLTTISRKNGAGNVLVAHYAESPYSGSVRFEWDENKDEVNRAKHGISFETAALVFEDANRLLFVDRVEDGEERWHAIGSVRNTFLFLTVVHTYAEEHAEPVVRIISARRATRRERKLYAETIP